MILTASKIYIDTAPFIYYLEKNTHYYNAVREFFAACYHQHIPLVTSAVTMEEYCVFPFSNNDTAAVLAFDQFLRGMQIDVVNVDKTVALRAAEVRSEYKYFKALDAIHLATAMLTECDVFLTNDNQLRQAKNIRVVTADNIADLF